ncbi:hypothetical protein H2204_004982 [Knufia peltigerae]|uniref:Uncharacterized protein n=1 Tax=Knufia peltigerae TaxID=1002370 RepID=A0AA39CYY1_9EURO|nr:hypothetical protein H2204_004982 [Knufia peltigerae]
MNVFRKRAKAKDDAYTIPPAAPSDFASMSKMSRSLKRKQKNAVEIKPEIDLSTALPNTNDFRTSLLMPGLSARFSMLREQDDPNTKLGKASDDSVLFPKRASRMNLFNHNPLTDIAEVESIHTPVKAPFADPERSHSFSELDDQDSVLNRSRPTEGNNLFSGRQKMYRIPTASTSRELSGRSTPLTSSKHVYQNDVAMSSYQQLRLKAAQEREECGEEAEEERDGFPDRPISTGTDEHEHASVVNTPSTGFSKSRGTTSSTASGPSNRRTSTAATSVISDSPAPRQSQLSAGSHTKGSASEFGSEDGFLRRDPSQESRQGNHESGQFNQPPLPSSPPFSRQLSQSKSTSHLPDKSSRSNSPFPGTTPRATSPFPSLQTQALASLDFGLKSSVGTFKRYQTTSPTEDEHGGDVYSSNLKPSDRGKATAMGLFNRPQQQFDERQFEARQMQMYGPPVLTNVREAHTTGSKGSPENTAAPSIPPSPFEKSYNRPSEASAVAVSGRPRAQSSASSTNAAQVQAKVEALIKRQNEEFKAFRASKPNAALPDEHSPSKTLMEQPVASRGTFFDTSDGSDEDEATDLDSPMLGRYEPAPRLAKTDVHPALRDVSQGFDFVQKVRDAKNDRPHSDASAETSSPSVVHDTPDTSDSLHLAPDMKGLDSPTLGPATGLGLSGLIRTHLRHDSDRSSMMPPPSPVSLQGQHPNLAYREREPSIASTARTINPPESTHSDPWELDHAHRNQRSPLEPPANDAMSSMSRKAQQILGQAISHKTQSAAKAQQLLGSGAPTSMDDTRQWQNDMMSSHHRGESTETQKEFDNELAERAKKIQEGLRGVTESEKRSRSPGPRQALHALRHRTSKTSVAPRINESQPKAMKMLGITDGPGPAMGARSPNVDVHAEFNESSDEHDDRHTPRQRPGAFDGPNGRSTPGPWRQEPQEDYDHPRQRSATPNARMPRRDRSESGAADRSRSRTGRYAEERPPFAAEYSKQGLLEHREQHRPYGPPRGPPRGPPPVEPRNNERSSSAMSNRRPSGNRAGQSDYFDGRAGTPIIANAPRLGDGQASLSAPRPSPRPPFPHSPISPFGPPGLSPGLPGNPASLPAALPSPSGPLPAPPPATGRSTPIENNRLTIIGARKKSVTKGMISEPTFISSTSSVPLVGLPNGPRPREIPTPPVPAMHPQRRRAGTFTEQTTGYASPRMGSPLPMGPDSPSQVSAAQSAVIDQQLSQKPQPRPRNRLRKISSEGGSMAARARNQALMAEFGREKLRSPALPVFPNRSATALGLHQEGGMF